MVGQLLLAVVTATLVLVLGLLGVGGYIAWRHFHPPHLPAAVRVVEHPATPTTTTLLYGLFDHSTIDGYLHACHHSVLEQWLETNNSALLPSKAQIDYFYGHPYTCPAGASGTSE